MTLSASIKGTFRVRCYSIGGRALSMFVTGPDNFSSDLSDIKQQYHHEGLDQIISLQFISRE